jgi:hypothetical protein
VGKLFKSPAFYKGIEEKKPQFPNPRQGDHLLPQVAPIVFDFTNSCFLVIPNEKIHANVKSFGDPYH